MYESFIILLFTAIGSFCFSVMMPRRKPVFATATKRMQLSQRARRLSSVYTVLAFFTLSAIAFYHVYQAAQTFSFEF